MEHLVRPFGVPNGGRRLTRHREPTQSVQCSGPGVKGVEGLALNYPPVEGQTLHWRPSDRSLIVPVRSLWQEPDATCLGHVTPEDKKKALPG